MNQDSDTLASSDRLTADALIYVLMGPSGVGKSTLAQALIDAGAITDQQAAAHPARGRLTRYIGMVGEALPDARRVTLRPDDRLLLCSDGLTGMLDDARIQAILNRSPDPQHACRTLTEAANDAGGTDNITVLVIAPA